jgi:hypothetical protein
MDTNATNGIENTEVDLVDERTLDNPTNVEQNGGNGQHTASEQVFEENMNSSHMEAQTDNIDDNAQSLNEGNTENADSQSLTTRPKRQTKPTLKSVQNRMQTEEFKTTKLWDKVQSAITTLQTTPDSIPQIRFAISKVRAAFHDYHMSIVSYIDYLVRVGTLECTEEREKIEHILDYHKYYVDTVVTESNERKKELTAEMGSARLSSRASSRASSASSAALRAQARGDAAAAIKKAELQKKRNEIESQSALQIQEQELALSRQKINEKARLEQLRLEEEAAVAVAKVTAIENELGISDPQGLDLPEEHVDEKVNNYLENQYEFTPDNIDIAQPFQQQHSATQPFQQQHSATQPFQQQHSATQPFQQQHSATQPFQQQHPATQPFQQQHPAAQPFQQQHPATQPFQQQHPATQPFQQQHPATQPFQQQHPAAQPSQPLDPMTSAFHPTTQTSPPSKPGQDTMKSYIDFMARRELIANKIEKFDDQPGNYHVWKESFQNMIRHVNITPSEELSLITEHTTKNSKKLVQQLRSAYIKNPAKGVKEVWS